MTFKILDSGDREEFDTGMVRDVRGGKGRYDLLPVGALRRWALHLERGAEKYDERNWELGAPYCRFWDSAVRHLCQWMAGMEDEDHLAAALFNIGAIVEFQERGRTELDNRPHKDLDKAERMREYRECKEVLDDEGGEPCTVPGQPKTTPEPTSAPTPPRKSTSIAPPATCSGVTATKRTMTKTVGDDEVSPCWRHPIGGL